MAIGLLDYKKLVGQNFDFLLSEFRYTLLTNPKNSYVVSYACGSVTIDVMYDVDRSFELDIRLSYTDTRIPIESFSLYEIVHAGGGQGFRTPQVADEQSMAYALHNCAMTLKRYGDSLLRQDGFGFRRLSKYRQQRSIDYEIATTVRMLKAEADVAWRNRNYVEVFALLDPIRKHLSNSELKKLKYSQNKFGFR